MTAKITISIPDDLKRMIDAYNKRHPFEPLIISQLAQKAVFEKIKREDPQVLTILPQVSRPEVNTPVKAREIQLETELSQPSQETQHTVICAECGKEFLAQRKTRKYCSNKCKTAYGRKHKT